MTKKVTIKNLDNGATACVRTNSWVELGMPVMPLLAALDLLRNYSEAGVYILDYDLAKKLKRVDRTDISRLVITQVITPSDLTPLIKMI